MSKLICIYYQHGHGSTSIMAVFRYYTDKIRHSSNKNKTDASTKGYV